VGARGGSSDADLAVLEGQLTWLVHVIGAVVRGRQSSSAADSQARPAARRPPGPARSRARPFAPLRSPDLRHRCLADVGRRFPCMPCPLERADAHALRGSARPAAQACVAR